MTDLLDDIVPAQRLVEFTLRLTNEEALALGELTNRRKQRVEDVVGSLLLEALADKVDVRRTLTVEYRNNGSTGYAKAFKHVCSGCGREFDSNRRQLPGKRVWCGRAECKKEASALRARDYRDRKAKEPA